MEDISSNILLNVYTGNPKRTYKSTSHKTKPCQNNDGDKSIGNLLNENNFKFTREDSLSHNSFYSSKSGNSDSKIQFADQKNCMENNDLIVKWKKNRKGVEIKSDVLEKKSFKTNKISKAISTSATQKPVLPKKSLFIRRAHTLDIKLKNSSDVHSSAVKISDNIKTISQQDKKLNLQKWEKKLKKRKDDKSEKTDTNFNSENFERSSTIFDNENNTVSEFPNVNINNKKDKKRKKSVVDIEINTNNFQAADDNNTRKPKRHKIEKLSNSSDKIKKKFEQSEQKVFRGPISSLFKHNPEIPLFAHRVVKPIEEAVFSSESFSVLSLHPHMVSNLKQTLNLETMTLVQQKTIPVLLSKKDALVKSQTGSGKTIAYAVPVIEDLHNIRPKILRQEGTRALIIVPTRELALQTYECFVKLVKPYTWIVPGCLTGGEKRKAEKARLRKGVTILIGTPGRLLDHVNHTKCLKLNKVSWLVIDEADTLFDMSYEKDVASLIEAVNTSSNEKNEESNTDNYEIGVGISRCTVLLSATLTSAVENLAGLTLKSPVYIDAAVDSDSKMPSSICDVLIKDLVIPNNLTQYYVVTPPKLRLVTLSAFILWKSKLKNQKKILVFCATPHMVDYHTELLTSILAKKSSVSVESDEVNILQDLNFTFSEDIQFFQLHGNMSQKERIEVFKRFREGNRTGVLMCTDVAARGIDLPQVDWIVQYTAPTTTEEYVHRVGRTARVGSSGSAIIFLSPSEIEFVRLLEDRRISLKEETVKTCLENLLITEEQNWVQSKTKRTFPAFKTFESAASALQSKYENAVLDNKNLHDLAIEAYTSWARFYASYPKETRNVFNFKQLHLGHFAKSFALREAPTSIGGLGQRKWMKKQEKEKEHEKSSTKEKRKKASEKQDSNLFTSEFFSGVLPAKKKKKFTA